MSKTIKRTSRNPEETRKELLKAAKTIFCKKSISSAKLEDIALEAGVTRGAISHHFTNKEKMVIALIEDAFYKDYYSLFQLYESDDTPLVIMKNIIKNLIGDKEDNYTDVVLYNNLEFSQTSGRDEALAFVDGLFINPIIGKKKSGDFTDDVILASYEALMKYYYPKERAVMSILRTSMKYAGPREAIHHAIMRKNFGCTHFIVGRDHAGVGDYYGPYDAHDIFTEFPDLGITPLFFRSFSRFTKCNSVVNDKICPHEQKHHVNFAGKKIRAILRDGKVPPEDMMRKEVSETILKFDKTFVE